MTSDLPIGWASARLLDLGEINPKHSAETDRDQIISFVPMAGVSDTEGRIVELIDKPLADVWKGYTHFAEGDVLFAKITPCMENGKTAIAGNLRNGLGCGSTEFYVVRSNGAVLPDYIHPFLRQQSYRAAARAAMTGAVGQLRVPKSFVENTVLPLPPLNEQRRIVAKIEALMARNARAKEALAAIPALLDRYRQSVLAAAFRGDLTADWRAQHPDVEPASELLVRIRAQRRSLHNQASHSGRSKRYQEPARQEANDLPDLPQNWLWVRWGEVGFCQNGRAFPSADYTDNGVKLLRPGNLHVSGSVEWTEKNTRCLPERYADDHPSHLVGPAELIMNLTAQSLADEFLGRVCLTDRNEHCLLNQRLARLTPVELSPHFCLWLFKSPVFRRYVEAGLNTGSLIQHMFTSNVDQFVFPLPPAIEQDAIVEAVEQHLSAIDIVGAAVCNAAAALPKMDQSILTKAFRGELVPQDPNDEPASELLARIKAKRAANGTLSRRGGRRKRAATPVV